MVGSPKLLCDVVTVYHTVDGTGSALSEPTVIRSILTKVRLCEGSGDRRVDALGTNGARKALLYWFVGISTTDGNLTVPVISAGDKIMEGSTDSLDEESAWTVSGRPVRAKGATTLHHLEVSLV